MSLIRKLILFSVLFDPGLKIGPLLSDAWAIGSSLHRATTDTECKRSFPPTQHSASACDTNDDDEWTSQSRRRAMLQLGSLVLPGMVIILGSPLVAASAEVDPFAAMDDLLSEAGTSTSTGLPSSFASPGSPATNNNSNNNSNNSNSNQSGVDSSKTKAAPSKTSDMEAALQESRKRRTIDPRTHG